MNTPLVVALIVLFIASVILNKKVFPSIYAKTKINPFTFVQKLLCAVIGLSLLLCLGDTDYAGLVIIAIVLCVILLALSNLRYKNLKYIAIVTLANTVFGIAFSVRFAIWVLSLAANMAGLVLGGKWSMRSDFSLFGSKKYYVAEEHEADNPVPEWDAQRQADAAAFAESEKERNNEAAEAYAQSQGFSSADEAEDYGIKTGKQD